MIPQKYLHFLRRFFQMGPRIAGWLLYHRLKKRHFIKTKGTKGRKNHNLNVLNDFCQKILYDPEFIATLPEKFRTVESIFAQADKACIPQVTILGSGTFTFSPDCIPWHQDFTTSEPTPASWQTNFFADISLPNMDHHTKNTRYPDIKVPWELSRLHHFFELGLGYHHAQMHNDQERGKRYSAAFVQQTTSWMVYNPFLQGVNWTNPMEVAIRAVNFVWAFHFFKNVPSISQTFWQNYITMLHEHIRYLENTWEVSQKPNNHYIADLVGHLYLTACLGKTTSKTVQKLIGQWKHQILPDGTSYEGSTRYHKLVAEMMMHFLLACKHNNIPLPPEMAKIYAQMKQFLADCTDQGGTMALIGDDDSGKVVAGFESHTQPKNSGVTTYRNFGLSIIRAPDWHVTLRHPTYQSHQPTGHFHQDMLSITLSIDGIPIIVDPGTYVYTANAAWRNDFRSIQSHNTFFLEDELTLPTDLFQLNCLQHPIAPQVFDTQKKITMSDLHSYYKHYGLIAHRKVTLEPKDNALIITDWWEKILAETEKNSGTAIWAIHFAPEITLEKDNDSTWYVIRNQQRLAIITTTLRCSTVQGWVCPEYGSLMQGTILTASYPQTDDPQTIQIQKLPL